MSEVETAKRTLISEDRVNVRTYTHTDRSDTFYSADLEVNDREHSGDIYTEEFALGHIRMLATQIYKKAKALYYVNDPKAADALADDIVRDAAELIAATRALANTVKGRKVH